jgi:hypothetical protein
VAPAQGDALHQYSESIGEKVSRAKDAALYEYFCTTTFGTPCPSDIDARLEGARSGPGDSIVDVADSFVRLRALADRPTPSEDPVSNAEYVAAAYHVILNRAHDQAGYDSHVSYLERDGERKIVLRKFFESPEFKSK